MNISIQAYWGAKVQTVSRGDEVPTAEEWMKEKGKIILCEVIIENKFIGSVSWDGTNLAIEKKETHSERERRERIQSATSLGWAFPEKLPCFDPKGKGELEKVFQDPVALVAYAQYKRHHIVEYNENLWLPSFSLRFSRIVKKLQVAGSLSLDLVVSVWMQLWRGNPMYMNFLHLWEPEIWTAILKPILPFINGEKKLKLIEEDGKFLLITEIVRGE